MVIYTYIMERESYDYFGGHRRDTKCFNTLKEAWAAYAKSRKFDRYYDDGSFYETHQPRLIEKFVKEYQPKHGQVLGYKPVPPKHNQLDYKPVSDKWGELEEDFTF